MATDPHVLLEKIKALPAERRIEIEDFVDFILAREEEKALLRTGSAASESAFGRIWSNPEDDVYDAL